jgi:hypothetical protein
LSRPTLARFPMRLETGVHKLQTPVFKMASAGSERVTKRLRFSQEEVRASDQRGRLAFVDRNPTEFCSFKLAFDLCRDDVASLGPGFDHTFDHVVNGIVRRVAGYSGSRSIQGRRCQGTKRCVYLLQWRAIRQKRAWRTSSLPVSRNHLSIFGPQSRDMGVTHRS